MYYEKLALEVGASVAGFTVLKPPVIRGESGIEHSFTFVATDGPSMYTFDIYSTVGQTEILRTYLKKMDTGARSFVVCLSGRPTREGLDLADSYGIELLGPSEVGDFFSGMISRQIEAPRAATAPVAEY